MPSTLFSAPCYIKSNAYLIYICIDDEDDIISVSTAATCELKLNIANSPCSIRISFEPMIKHPKESAQSRDVAVPSMILLHHLLSIKTVPNSPNNNAALSSTSLLSANLFYDARNQNRESNQAKSAQILLSYIHISERFIWTVKQLQITIDSDIAGYLCSITMDCLSSLKHRPHRLLVFVNPRCGKNSGRSIYERRVQPLFLEAGINVETVYTERANHAKDYITQQSLEAYDGVICVGGDGTFSELCHGLLLKTAQDIKLDINDSNVNLVQPNLRIGIIPAGSTDAVVFGTTGHNDPVTSALQIIVGESLFIDVATVHNERGFVRFMATMLSYGFFGNIIEQSEDWRSLGPIRYDLSGFYQFVRNTSYHAEVIITQAPQKDLSNSVVDDTDDASSLVTDVQRENNSSASLQIKRQDRYKTINCLNMPCRCFKSKFGMSPSVHYGDGSFDVILVTNARNRDFLFFLHQVARDGRAIEDLSNVERFRATEVIIRPIANTPADLGRWACDGELITGSEIRIRAHHQVLNMFASGIRLEQIKKINATSTIFTT